MTRRLPFHLTDMGNADRFVARHGDDVRFVNEDWYFFDGRRWVVDRQGETERRAKDTVRAIAAEASVRKGELPREAILAWQHRSESQQRLAAMLKVARSDPKIAVDPSVFDSNAYLLNLTNGTLDLRSMKFRRHDREDMITKLAGTRYDPKAVAQRWESFVREVFCDDDELIGFMRRLVGYSLTGDTREQVLIICHGRGANGKTTFVEVLRDLLGEYAMQGDFSNFVIRKNFSGPRNDIARLRGARLVTAVEVQADATFDETLVKQLTGGDVVTARFLYREAFEFRPQFKLLLVANHLPGIKHADEGIWRRILVVPFDAFFEPGDRDMELREKLVLELPGILNWALAGVRAWQDDGLRPPRKVLEALTAYRGEVDPTAEFLENRCRLDPSWS